MQDQIFIQHRFTIEQDGLTLQDAIVLPQADYEALSDKDIEALKTERFANFKEAVTNPPKQPEPTKEEQLVQVEEQLASIEEQKQVLTAQKTELSIASIYTAPVKVIGGK